jgi:hypothetical protein
MPQPPTHPADPADLFRFHAPESTNRRYVLWGAMAAVAVVALAAGLAWNHWRPGVPVAGTAEPGAAPAIDRGAPIEAEVHTFSDAIVVRNMTTADWPAGQVDLEAKGTIYRTTFSSLPAGRDLRLNFAEFHSDAGEGFAVAGAAPEKLTIHAGGGTLTKELVPPPTSAPEAASVPPAATAIPLPVPEGAGPRSQ